jgi:hypothetical protein
MTLTNRDQLPAFQPRDEGRERFVVRHALTDDDVHEVEGRLGELLVKCGSGAGLLSEDGPVGIARTRPSRLPRPVYVAVERTVNDGGDFCRRQANAREALPDGDESRGFVLGVLRRVWMRCLVCGD